MRRNAGGMECGRNGMHLLCLGLGRDTTGTHIYNIILKINRNTFLICPRAAILRCAVDLLHNLGPWQKGPKFYHPVSPPRLGRI